MKKLHMGMAAGLILMLLLVGCQKETQPTPSASQPQNSQTEQLPDTQMPEAPAEDISDMITTPELEGSTDLDKFMTDFEAALGESGLTITDKISLDASVVGAEAGYRGMVNNFGFEVYLFDSASDDEKTIENLKTASESGYITIFGIEINGEEQKPECTVQENIVLIFPGEEYGMLHPDKESIVKAFMDISI